MHDQLKLHEMRHEIYASLTQVCMTQDVYLHGTRIHENGYMASHDIVTQVSA